MSSAFNIFALPLIVIDCLMKNMDDFTFIETSKMNKTAKWTAKHTAPTRKPSLLMANFASLHPVLEFESPSDGKMKIGNETSKNNALQYSCNRREIRRQLKNGNPPKFSDFEEDSIEAILSWTNHITELFQVPLSLVWLSSGPQDKPGDFEKIMEKLPQSEGLFVCRTDDYTVDQINTLMERAMKCKRVHINFQRSHGPTKLDFTGSNFNDFSMLEADWVRLEHVLSATFKRFFVNGSTLSSENVNELIKKWKGGWNPQMREFITVSSSEYHQPTVLKDLDATYNAAWRQFEYQNFCPRTFARPSSISTVDEGGWEIRRESDGHLARIEVSDTRSVIVYVWTPEELAAMEIVN